MTFGTLIKPRDFEMEKPLLLAIILAVWGERKNKNETKWRQTCYGWPGAFFKAWCRACGMDIPCTRHGVPRFFVFFIRTAMVDLTFNRWESSKNSHVLSSRIFILEKALWGGAIRNGSTKNFKMMIFGYLTKYGAFDVFCFSLFAFVPEKPHVDPKKHCFWDGMNLAC